MAKISLAGFKDPVRRPRFIIWTLVTILVIAGVMIPVLGVTSTRWFCTEGCHKVQDDTITAYQHSSHAQISCMACHMPVNANPVIFIVHKAEALGELYMTVTNKYELPLNAESEVALTMTPDHCTQCHSLATRVVSPSAGIKINHDAHTSRNVSCTVCHNRIAHREDFAATLIDPVTGKTPRKHDDFTKMTACFRCHGLEAGSPAPGTCSACHTTGFTLKPPSHLQPDFFPKGHADLAKESLATVAETLKERGIAAVTPEVKTEFVAASKDGKADVVATLAPVGAINYCSTCHVDTFCTNCHGTTIPHSAEFKEPKDANDPLGHPAISKTIAKKCVMCHGDDKKTHFCSDCHHGKKVGTEFNPAKPWTTQHPIAVAKSGVKSCTTQCHTAKFCVDCHTSRKVFPASHKQSRWTRPVTRTMTAYGVAAAAPSALHAKAFAASAETCSVCHGAGGTAAPFCKACHKVELPHSDEFKKFHGNTGRKNPKVCLNCHNWPELCSNCHHIGSSVSKPWIALHGASVNKNGADGCLKVCHKQTDCQACHTKRKVIPASHKSKAFKKVAGNGLGQHAVLYQKNSAICTYCHAGAAAALPSSKFCMNCHKLVMPHATGFGLKDSAAPASKTNGGAHVQLLVSKKASRAVCTNCHEATFCNSCHHKGAPTNKPWVRYHPTVVKKTGATPCFDCHQETFCSNCHVNLAKRGL